MLLWKSQPFLAVLLLAYLSSAQQCQPKFLLESTLQDNVVLNVFQPSASGTLSQYNYPFSAKLFTAQPSVLVSIGGFNLRNYAEINYALSTSIKNSTLVVQFESTNMAWQSVAVNLILHSRQDLFSEVNSISVTANNQAQIPSIKQLASPAESLIITHHILGIRAEYSTSYQFQIDALQVSGTKGKYGLLSNTNATFIIQTLFFGSLEKNFQYGLNQIVWEGSQTSTQYQQIWMDFAPVTYVLYGISKLTFTGLSLSLSTNFDPTNELFSLKASPEFSQLEMMFVAIGRPSKEVCSPCDNYISVSGCFDQCPVNYYAASLADGGKTCRPCLSVLGQTVNLNGRGCACPNGQSFFEGNCYKPGNQPLSCSRDQIYLHGKCWFKNISQVISCPTNSHANNSNLTACICDDGFEKVNSTCLKACPSHSSRTSFGICACNFGYIMNSSFICESICPSNSIYRVDLQQCRCNYGFQMINGQCSQCPQGQIFDPSTSRCLTAFFSKAQGVSTLSMCQVNEVAVNGQCQCDQWSIRISNRCVQCPFATYKAGNQCKSCPQYCANCTSGSSCNQCRRGFNNRSGLCVQICGDGRRFVLECDDGNQVDGDGCSSECTVEKGYVCNGGSPISTDVCQKLNPAASSMKITIEKGYPMYLSSGIVINFIVNPPVARSNSQLWKMFKISFNPSNARPASIVLNQLENDPVSIRCFFNYNNNPPNLAFIVDFQVEDQTYGSAKISLPFDTITNAVTSAFNTRGVASRDRLT